MGCTASRSGIEPFAGRFSGHPQLSRSYSMPIQPRDDIYHTVALTSSTYGSLRLDSLPLTEDGQISGTSEYLADGNLQKINDKDSAALIGSESLSMVTEPFSEVPTVKKPKDITLSKGAEREVETINMWELMQGLEEDNVTSKVFQDSLSMGKVSEKSLPADKSRILTRFHTVEDLDGGIDVRRSLPADYCFRRGTSKEAVIPPGTAHGNVLDAEIGHQTSPMQLRRLSLGTKNHQIAPESMVRKRISRSQEFVKPPLPRPKEVKVTTRERHSLSEIPAGDLKSDVRRVAMRQPDPVLRSPMLRGLSGHERLRLHPGQQSPMTRTKPSGSHLRSSSFSLDESTISSPSTSEITKQPVAISSPLKPVVAENTFSTRKGLDHTLLSRGNSEATPEPGKITSKSTKQPSSLPRVAVSRPTGPYQGGSKISSAIKPTVAIKVKAKGTSSEGNKTSSVHLSHLPKIDVKSGTSIPDNGKYSRSKSLAVEATSKSVGTSVKRVTNPLSQPAVVPKTITIGGVVSTQDSVPLATEKRRSADFQSKTARRSPPLAPRVANAIAALSAREAKKSSSGKETSRRSDVITSGTERRSSIQAISRPKIMERDVVPLKVEDSATLSSDFASTDSISPSRNHTRMTSSQGFCVDPTTQSTPVSPALETANGIQERKRRTALPVTNTSSLPSSRGGSGGSKTPSQGTQESVSEDPIAFGYEHISHAEVAEAVLNTGTRLVQDHSGSPKVQSTNPKSWSSDNPPSPPFDAELLAFFEEELELLCADDWCDIRISEGDASVTSVSSADTDSPSWTKEAASPTAESGVDGEVHVEGYKILDDHIRQPSPQQGSATEVFTSMVSPLDSDEQKIDTDPLQKFKKKCPPGGEARCVLYTTSLRGIRKTFEDCSRMRLILQSLNVLIDERDIAMHAEFRQELKDLTGNLVSVPRVFIKGRYIGGADEVSELNDDGILGMLLEGVPTQVSRAVCGGCGGVRFIPCSRCSGSCKMINEEDEVLRCTECNENGLIRCPMCF